MAAGADWATAAALDFLGPLAGGTAAGNLGDTTGRAAVGPVTVTGLNWLPGETLWIRWADKNDSGDDHGLAIDDLDFSANAIPEPMTSALGLIGLGAIAAWRRRCN